MPEGTHTINGQVQTQPFAAAIPKPISEHSSFRHEYTERRDGMYITWSSSDRADSTLSLASLGI